MNRGERVSAWVVIVVAAGLSIGCATTSRDVVVPRYDRLHVAVFVDETPTGEVGLGLTEAVQSVVWTKDPESLAQSFDERSVTIDGTVTQLVERDLGDDVEISIRVGATLRARDGSVVTDLGLVDSIERYRRTSSAADTKEARRAALDRATWKMAKHLVREIDRVGRAEAAAPAVAQR